MKNFLLGLVFILSFAQVGISQVIIVDERTKDTVILTTKTVTPPPYTTTEIVRKPYKPTVPIPTPTSKYLSLPVSNPLVISGQSNVIIDGRRFENSPGKAIRIQNSSNITIRGCFINKAGEEAIDIENSSNITIEACLIGGAVTGVYALNSQTIKVINNQFFNVRLRTQGGRGQFVQFNGVSGPGNAVDNNRGENWLGESNPEDLVSFYASSGTAASPISCRNNMFRGGGPSASGGGIMTGDHGGGYQIVENNTLLDPGQYGIASSSGTNIQLINNKIYARQQPFTNNPLYVWKQSETTCSNITVKGNRVNWTDKLGVKNNGWNAGNCSNVTFEYPTTITLAEMNVPAHLLNFVTPEELLKIRGK